jgi:hypothetical protein
LANVHLALVHYPVYNKKGEEVVSSVTTLDVHDISRACTTFQVANFFIVTPLKSQQELVNRMVEHWQTGYGAEYNPTRTEALLKTVVKRSLEDVIDSIEHDFGKKPKTVVTGAKRAEKSLSFEEMKKELTGPGDILLIFGTGWGLVKHLMQKADCILEPIEGRGEYNHLPVRAAIAIILDRLLSEK